MSAIPSNLARVPNLLASQIVLSSLTASTTRLVRSQSELATGLAVARPSDNAIAASGIASLDDAIERRDQRLRNLDHADAVLANLDAALADANELMLEAKAIGSSQIGIGSDETTRRNQARVIDSILNSMLSVANRDVMGMHLFGGHAVGKRPFETVGTGIAYRGRGNGLSTDLGLATAVPITMGGTTAFGALSARVQGDRDLDPVMGDETPLEALRGANGHGVNLGAIAVNINATEYTLDLSESHTAGDVRAALESLIQSVDPGATVTIDNSNGSSFSITPSAGVTISISDAGTASATASDLGLAGVYPGGTSTAGADLDPRVTEMTAVTSLRNSGGASLGLGVVRITNAGQSREVDLSTAQNVQDVMNAVEALGIGVRVVIGEDGRRLDFLNELSGSQMSISEVSGGDTASQLGVRTLTASTELAHFNGGLGVEILPDYYNPVTGLREAAKDVDFRITSKSGVEIDVDLGGALTVQDVLDRIDAAAAAAGLGGQVFAGLASDGNGITITDLTAGTTTTVASLNGSHAAEDLGIVGETSSATLVGADRATVAVDSVFSHLIALRDALEANDQRGITIASERLEQDLRRTTEARAEAGVRSRRVLDARDREEELRIQDMTLRSTLRDLDYTEASLRFAALQQQLQAGLASAGRIGSLSLLDFLR